MKTFFNIHRSILLACFLLCHLAYGQQKPQNFYPQSAPLTPEAASLIKAINYPVGYNTGVPEISVPLYEVKSRGINMPISLNYHAGGFKAKEIAPPTGLGWNLSTNFQITREVQGFDDFRKSSSGYAGYYYNDYGITDAPWNNALYDDLRVFSIANGMFDTQPDRFYYNIAGKSGSFYLSKTKADRVFLPSPYNGVSISCTPSSGSSSSVDFKITDTDGTEYFFTLAEVVSDANYQTSAYESSWKCTSIVSADKTETVRLDYEALKNLYVYTNEEYTELYEDIKGLHGNEWNAYGGTVYADEVQLKTDYFYTEALRKFPFFKLSVPRAINYSLGGDAGLIMYTKEATADFGYTTNRFYRDFLYLTQAQIQSRYAISTIKTSNMTIDFTYDASECLKLIKMTDIQNRTFRKFYFDQTVVGSYISQSQTDQTNYLDKLRIVDAGEKTISYAFEYSSKYAFSNYTKGGNYWGGVNSWTSGRNSQIGTTVPSFRKETKYYYGSNYNNYVDDFAIYVGGQYLGAMMMHNMVDPQYSLLGQLEKITYPTGGYTEFSFGSNQGNLADGSYNGYRLGGLRINEMRNYNNDGSLLNKKIYKYGQNGSGIPMGIYGYSRETIADPFRYEQEVEYFVNPVFEYSRVTADERDILEKKTTYLANILESMTYSNGSPVYYDKVVEYDYSTAGENGKKEYLYTAPDQFGLRLHRRLDMTNLLAPEEGWRLGRLEYENTYRSSGNEQYELVHSVHHEYNYYMHSRTIHTDMPFRHRIVMGVYEDKASYRYNHVEITDPMLLKELGSSGYVRLYSTNIYTGAVYPVRKTETSYDGGNHSQTITQYTYDKYIQPATTTVTYPDGYQEKESLEYANDFSTSIPFIQAMRSANQVGIPVKIERSQNGSALEGVIRLFQPSNPALVEKIYTLAPGGSTPSASDNGMSLPAGYYRKALFGYDAQRNLVEKKTNDDAETVYLWGYGNQYIIAEIRNSNYNAVATVLGNSVITTLQNSYDPNYMRQQVQILRAHPQMKDAQVSTFTYSFLNGVNEVTGPDGVKKGYVYDGSGRMILVNDHEGKTTHKYDYHYIH